MDSLWGFTKQNLKADIKGTPHGILRDQIDHFDKNTNNVLFGRMKNVFIKNPLGEYPLATSFEIVAPSLDGYSYRLFTMYCKPESEFPVLIVKRHLEEPVDITEYDADYTCKNEQEFTEVLEKVLASDDTTRIVQTLYSKSNL